MQYAFDYCLIIGSVCCWCSSNDYLILKIKIKYSTIIMSIKAEIERIELLNVFEYTYRIPRPHTTAIEWLQFGMETFTDISQQIINSMEINSKFMCFSAAFAQFEFWNVRIKFILIILIIELAVYVCEIEIEFQKFSECAACVCVRTIHEKKRNETGWKGVRG